MSPLATGIQVMFISVLTLLMVALGFALWRLVKGPSAPDRIVALDLIAAVSVGIIGVYTALTREPHLLHVGMGLALISFLGTVAVARYLEKGQS